MSSRCSTKCSFRRAPTLNGGKLPQTPADLVHYNLLRSDDELWRPWFDAAGRR